MTSALRIALSNPPDHLHAFHHRHPQIEQGDVGTVTLVGGDGLDSVAGFRDDPQVGLLVDDVGDAGAEQRVIVHEQDAAPGPATPAAAVQPATCTCVGSDAGSQRPRLRFPCGRR